MQLGLWSDQRSFYREAAAVAGRQRRTSAKRIRFEWSYGSLSRSFSLPSNVDVEGIKAEYKDAVLAVRLTEHGVPMHRHRAYSGG
jgi:HSP20 family molecular chaperone IbpA